MAIESIEQCVIKGEDATLTFTVGDISDATFVVQIKPDSDVIRRSMTSDPNLLTLSDTTLSVSVLSDDFDSLADTALTVARYSLITLGSDGSISTVQTGPFKIFRYPR